MSTEISLILVISGPRKSERYPNIVPNSLQYKGLKKPERYPNSEKEEMPTYKKYTRQPEH